MQPAHATPAAMQDAIRKVVGQSPVRRGKVKLDVPPLIDNGNAVALSVAVDSPMNAAEHVKAIHVFTEKNPQPNVVSVYLGPRSGRATVTTRVRLADTQTVAAIAQLSDGSFWSDSADVVVTLAACLEELG
jgi:sulfur-oxidizing protein SoxY